MTNFEHLNIEYIMAYQEVIYMRFNGFLPEQQTMKETRQPDPIDHGMHFHVEDWLLLIKVIAAVLFGAATLWLGYLKYRRGDKND